MGSIVVSADGSTVIWAPKNGKVVLSRDQGGTWIPCAGLPDPPKLPDWAVLDVNQPPTSRHASGVVDAGFFDGGPARQVGSENRLL